MPEGWTDLAELEDQDGPRSVTSGVIAAELCDGPGKSPVYAGDEERRIAWLMHRDELIVWYRQRRPGHRPWAWWRYERHEDPPADQPTMLRDLGLLTASERLALRQNGRATLPDEATAEPDPDGETDSAPNGGRKASAGRRGP